jgi:hypothetical protein
VERVRRTTSREAPVGVMGMSMGDMEDLRSYEAAGMTRKAPMMLNLNARRPMKGWGGGSGQSQDEGSVNASSGNNPQ